MQHIPLVADPAATADVAATMIRTWHAEVVTLWHLQGADEQTVKCHRQSYDEISFK